MWLLRLQRAWRPSLCKGLTPLGCLAAAASPQTRPKAWRWVSGSSDRGRLQVVHPFHVLLGHTYGPQSGTCVPSLHQNPFPSINAIAPPLSVNSPSALQHCSQQPSRPAVLVPHFHF